MEAVQAATVAVAAATTPVCAWRGSCGRMSGRAEYVGWWVGRGAARRSARCTARGTVAAGSGGGGSDAVAWCRRRVAACRGWVVVERAIRAALPLGGGGRARVVAARCGRCVMGVPRGV